MRHALSIVPMRPPSLPISATSDMPFDAPSTRARSTDAEFPDVEIPMSTSPGTAEGAHLSRKHGFVAVVVGDGRENRRVGCECDARQRHAVGLEPADQLAREVLRVGGRTPIAAHENPAAALQRRDHAFGSFSHDTREDERVFWRPRPILRNTSERSPASSLTIPDRRETRF